MSKATQQQQQQQPPLTSFKGSDSDGKEFADANAMWSQQENWYGNAIDYWAKVPPTMDGVLGGLSQVHAADVRESKAFIESIAGVGRGRALDCGAGIGRVTRTLLLPLGFATVDLLEPLPHMLEQARKELDPARVGDFFQCSMQQATMLKPAHYDLILVQWAAIYLTDDDFVVFLKRCAAALKPGGCIFLKENCMSKGSTEFLVDKDDSSLTRSDEHYRAIYARAGMRVVKAQFQQNWPKNLFPVNMYSLQI